MKLERKEVKIEKLISLVKVWMDTKPGGRLGLLTSIDGAQLSTIMLDPANGAVEYWESPLTSDSYQSITTMVPQAHWFERINWDMFGIVPEGHPRLKHVILHDAFPEDLFPLRSVPFKSLRHPAADRAFHFMEVSGEGVYELPLGPIYGSLIEPGHFRFSCFGETIINLELQLGYVHRGIEKRFTEVPWQKARFLAESAASDSAAANALAHAIAIESLLEISVPSPANHARTLALEIERLSMHIADLAGLGSAIGFLGFSHNMNRLREQALELGQTLCGSRYLRAFIKPGGTMKVSDVALSKLQANSKNLREQLKAPITFLQESQVATERMEVASISRSLANEFGMVGVAARACGIDYDSRRYFPHGTYPQFAPPPAVELAGDILCRTRVRAREIVTSLDTVDAILQNMPTGESSAPVPLPEKLPSNKIACGIVEACRGELLHFVVTGGDGNIRRYCIKDPSRNNWTAVSIAIRDNLIADFPLCNRSLALSYSGNDL